MDAIATILSGTALSGAIDLRAASLAKIQMPASWTAANLTFQVSYDGTTFANLYDEAGNEITVTAAASRVIAVDVGTFIGARYLKVRSGTAGTPVNQGADRALQLSLS